MSAFPNTSKGVKKIRTSEILGLIATIVMAIGSILLLTAGIAGTQGEMTEELTVGVTATAGIGVVIFAIGAVIALIGLFVEISGLRIAGGDHQYFKYGLYVVIAQIVLTGIAAIPAFSGAKTWVSLFADVADIIVMLLVVEGCMALCKKVGDEELAARGKKVENTVLTMSILSTLCDVFSGVNIATTIMAIAHVVLVVVVFFMYMGYLKAIGKKFA